MHSLNINPSRNIQSPRGKKKKTLVPIQLASLKALYKCYKCHNYGHLSGSPNNNGSLKPVTNLTDAPVENNDSKSNTKVLTLKMDIDHSGEH